jgi:peptide-methionine (S)-S-oxide reductase
MSGIEGTRHFVLGTKMDEVPEGHKVAVFANGCFWGSEKGIWRLPVRRNRLFVLSSLC